MIRTGTLALLILAIAAPAHAATPSQRIAALERQRTVFFEQRNTVRRELARARTEIAQLKGPVPEQVAAIAREGNLQRLYDLVLSPARTNWACGGSVFIGQTFWSVDFNVPPRYC